MAVGLMYFVQYLFTHIANRRKCYLSIPGGVRKTLQKNLVQKFLDCKEEVRASIMTSDLIMAIVRDSSEVADIGFVKTLHMVCIVGKMMLALLFILAENRMAVLPVIVNPILLSIWCGVRAKTTGDAIDKKAEMQNHMIDKAGDIVANIRMIADFMLREVQADAFDRKIGAYLKVENDARSVLCTNISAGPWITVFSVSVYVALGATVVDGVGDGMLFGLRVGTVSLGAFIATVNLFKEIGTELHEIYAEAMEIQMCFCPLKAITRLMNSESDLDLRMSANRRRRSEGKERRLASRRSCSTAAGDPNEFAVDRVIIYMKDVIFSYETEIIKGMQNPVVRSVSQEFDQGQIYAFIGPPRQGKATLLRLLGQVMIPNQGEGGIFFPPHLRVLHVSRESTVLHDTFLENLLLGQSLQQVGGAERVRLVCKRVGYDEVTIESLLCRADLASPKSWSALFTHTDYARLCLARVFLMNPEVLVIHHPVMSFGAHCRIEMLKRLREHVSERGIGLPTGKHMRRPRTMFFSASFVNELDVADRVFYVASNSGLREIVDREELTTGLLAGTAEVKRDL
eukprot:TRINITY_DN14351_c0_g1_i3.p1 TRINITY_DN14351_c0_g1~~TRINITY_DN14351_c0_g1_i3.p1  ORF type:complete len:569 (+),score=63.45 TRINITY_DN14351_c0_g1_i3:147-1853(+)